MAWSRPFGRQELRVVLLGNVGSGKSASGNILLGTSHFDCKFSACQITEQCSQAETVTREWGKLTVVDTPGLTAKIVKDNKEELLRCLQLSAPGPHVFLLVIPLGRFTQEEKDTVQRAAQLFKEHFYTFTIILFTFKDNLKNSSISDYISTAGESLQQLMQKCGHRYHAFNNNNPTEDDQAKQLLRKMNSLVEDNFGTYYTLDDHMREERMKRVRSSCAPIHPALRPVHLCQKRRHQERRHQECHFERIEAERQIEPIHPVRRKTSFSELPPFMQARPEPSPPVDLKEEFEKLKIHGLTEENLKKQAEILEKCKEELESKEKRLNDREEQVRKQEEEMEEKKKLK